MSKIKVNSLEGVGASTPAITIDNASGTCTANITNNLSNRNKIINGDMSVSQRNGATVVTGVNTTGYRIDRWTHQIDSINSAFSVSQSTDSPDEFGNSYKIDVTTADTSLGAAHAHFFRQKIEGSNLQDFAKGTSAAKQFAVSFYVKTNKTGLYTVELYDIDNNRAISKTFTVADSNWNRYTLIYPADTSGPFDNDNNNSLVLQFWLSAGSNYTSGTLNTSAWAAATQANRVSSSNVNLGDNTSNEWYLTGVQLEVGSVATDFEHRSFADELRRCQRYYAKYQAGTAYTVFLVTVGYGSNETDSRCKFDFVVEMRTHLPSFSYSSGSHFQDMSGKQLNIFLLADNGGSTAFTSMRTIFSQSFADQGKAYVIRAANNTSAYFEFDTEL